jgi:site-specific recombinase XerD
MDRTKSIQEFEKHLRRRFPGRRTAIDYTCDVRQFASLCDKPWREVTMHDMDAFVDQQRQSGLSQATVNRRVAALKVFFDFLAEERGDLSWSNPVRFKRHLPRDLSTETIERLWAVITSPRDQAWFALMLRAGLRVDEVVSLKLDAVLSPATADQPARLRVCGKGQKERIVLLTADAYAVLKAWLQIRPESTSACVFLNARGHPLTANGIQWLLRGYGQKIGVKVTPHQVRHTFARQLTEAGMPIASLSKLLGHAQVSTTQIYTVGADPELCQAYQNAMGQLADQPLPVTASPPQPQPETQAPLPETTSLPPLPDWETWAPYLPEALRQASLAFVRRRVYTWKPQHRRERALGVLAHFQRFWEWQLSQRPIAHPTELTLQDLRSYQAERSAQGKSVSTINNTLHCILGLLREQVDQGETVDASLFRLRSLPRPQSLPRHLSQAESQQLEATMRHRLDSPDPLVRLENACYFVLAHTGLRASECVALQFQDLDLAGMRLVVRQGKGDKDRVVYLSQIAAQAIAVYLDGQHRPLAAPLWIRPDGKLITYDWLHHHIRAVGQAAGVSRVTPHRLRHTLATRLLNVGMDITRLQKLLGHKYIGTTMIYARVSDSTLEANYRQAMRQIEAQHMPMSSTPIPVEDWPTSQPLNLPGHYAIGKAKLDNSV